MARPVYHQDYIARIRYSNALPPPPFLPKFLDIPNTGLSTGQYTSAGFASRLAREQPLNIEADAELGMPIDLIGIKGVFDGDESAIQFSDDPAPLHPKDRELLRPLNQLGKPMSITSGVSFLRRTEYITSAAPVNRDSRNAALRAGVAPRKKRKPDAGKDDPFYIHRSIIKGFNIAYPADTYTGPDVDRNLKGAEILKEEKDAWARPRHPTKPNLTLLDAYPILPDLDAFPDTGNYMIMKYQNNPCSNQEYDTRLDVALIQPMNQTSQEAAAHEEKVALHQERNPSRPAPLPEYRYQAFIPENKGSVENIKRKFSTVDPENDSEELYDSYSQDNDRRVFKYKRLRTYETYNQQQASDAWNDSVAMVLHDANTGGKQKAAYIYPVHLRTSIRAVRPITLGMLSQRNQARVEEENEERIDLIDLSVRDLTAEEKDRIEIEYLEKVDPPRDIPA